MDAVRGLESGTPAEKAVRGAEAKVSSGLMSLGDSINRLRETSPGEAKKITEILDEFGELLIERSHLFHPGLSQEETTKRVALALTAANLFLGNKPDYNKGAQVIAGLISNGYENQITTFFSPQIIPQQIKK